MNKGVILFYRKLRTREIQKPAMTNFTALVPNCP